MLTTSELADIGADAVSELRLSRWRVFYADANPEMLVNGRPVAQTAFNVSVNLTDGETFLTIRFRVENQRNASERDRQIRGALKGRLQELGV
jgi:hypothetical protein